MKQVWGHETFRPSQEAAINASLAGAELCAILPTGELELEEDRMASRLLSLTPLRLNLISKAEARA